MCLFIFIIEVVEVNSELAWIGCSVMERLGCRCGGGHIINGYWDLDEQYY